MIYFLAFKSSPVSDTPVFRWIRSKLTLLLPKILEIIQRQQLQLLFNKFACWIVEPQIDYKVKIGKSTLNALIGTSISQNQSDFQAIQAFNFLSDALLENPSAAGSSFSTRNGSQYKYNAVYGRLNYNWSDKYLLNLTARRDGSSRFGPGKQFGISLQLAQAGYSQIRSL